VAADHQLPSQHPIAASSAVGREHRLTWRTLQDVPVGPSVILSAACSRARTDRRNGRAIGAVRRIAPAGHTSGRGACVGRGRSRRGASAAARSQTPARWPTAGRRP
jgi:hypothetical protein